MDIYNKNFKKELLKSPLQIWWWNFGKKQIDFSGTVQEYLDKYNIKLRYKCVYENADDTIERMYVTAKYSYGNLYNIEFKSPDMEVVIRMIITTNLAYLGDKSKFRFNYRDRTINH